MGTRYADVVDIASVSKIVGQNYLNDAMLVKAGLVRMEAKPIEGTQVGWVEEKLFQDDATGQAIGVSTELTLKSKTQTKYQVPIVARGDAAEKDDIYGEISPKVKTDATAALSESISAKSSQIVDSTLIKVLDGMGLYMEGANTNYVDTGATAIAVTDITKTKDTRSDMAFMNGGSFVCRAKIYHKFINLGAVAFTSNTMGINAQNAIIADGSLGKIMGLNIVVTDKIGLAADASDYLSYILEPQSLILYGNEAPQVDPIQRAERGFQDIIKFKVRFGVGLEGMSWDVAQNDLVTNTTLALAASWSLAKRDVKFVPVAVLRCPVPSL